MAREWTPVGYIDEISPPGRDSPDAWIERVAGDVAELAPVEEDRDDAYRLRVQVGEVVCFSWQELHGVIPCKIWPDRHQLLASPPPTFTRVCTLYGEGGFVETSVDGIVTDIRLEFAEGGELVNGMEWPIEVTLHFFVDATEGLDFRLIDKGGALAFVPAEQLS